MLQSKPSIKKRENNLVIYCTTIMAYLYYITLQLCLRDLYGKSLESFSIWREIVNIQIYIGCLSLGYIGQFSEINWPINYLQLNKACWGATSGSGSQAMTMMHIGNYSLYRWNENSRSSQTTTQEVLTPGPEKLFNFLEA